jgi:hypothetical protein
MVQAVLGGQTLLLRIGLLVLGVVAAELGELGRGLLVEVKNCVVAGAKSAPSGAESITGQGVVGYGRAGWP